MKICSHCKLNLPTESFNVKNKNTGKLQSLCKECNKEKSRAYYAANKEHHKKVTLSRSKLGRIEAQKKLLDYLKDHPCSCGETHPAALDFDHLRDKKYGISDMVRQGYSWESIMTEIDKCQVLCANCHRKKTAKDFNWFSKDDFWECSSEAEQRPFKTRVGISKFLAPT